MAAPPTKQPAEIVEAGEKHAVAMAAIMNAIIGIGGTTSFDGAFDAARIMGTFIAPPLGISCFVAIGDSDAPDIMGFQALEWSDPDWPGDDRLPADWAIIATYVKPGVQKSGIGRSLFNHTLKAAEKAGVRMIDATIRHENTGGLAYYDKLGFTDYQRDTETVSKTFQLSGLQRLLIIPATLV